MIINTDNTGPDNWDSWLLEKHIFSQINARRHFQGRWGFAQGGRWGTPRRLKKKKWRLGVYVYVGVVGPGQNLKVLMTFLPVFLLLAHRPLNLQLFYLLCLYNFVVSDSRFYGDCPGQVVQNSNAIFDSCFINWSPDLSVIPPPPLEHCSALYSFCPMEGTNLVFSFFRCDKAPL